jgi:FixJ family two-component response regulator
MIKSPLISIVDDDESVRESLRSLIRSVGFEAELFSSAEAFLTSNQLSNTNCLILDLRMPGMSGLALQRQLLTTNNRVPIIFITAHGDEGARVQALNNGAVDFLPKPFSEEALLKAIYSALNSQKHE